MTKRDVLAFIFRYKNTVLGWWLFIAVAVTLMAYANPQAYRATSSILVERTKAPVAAASDFRAPERAEAMNTEVEILMSRPVLESVVEELRLAAPKDDRDPQPPSLKQRIDDWMVAAGLTTRADPKESWIESLAREVRTKPVVDSSVLTVSFTSSDPRLAMNVVNAVTDAYIDHRRGVYSSRGLGAHFKTQMEEAQRELETLRAELSAFKDANAMSAVADSRAELVRETGRLRDRIALLRETRTDLRTRYAQDHPKVQAANQNIASSQRQLSLRDRELKDLEQLQSTIDELGTLIQSQERIFIDHKRQYEQERAREAAPENFVNSRVIAYASLPAEPRLSRLFIIKLGLAGGFAFALLIAFVREYFNNRVTTPDQAERALGVPVLASIPNKAAIARA